MIGNELICGLLLTSMLLFTDFVPSPETRSFIGEVVLICLAFGVLLNILTTLFIQIRLVISQCQRSYKMRQTSQNKDEKLKKFLLNKINQMNAVQTQQNCKTETDFDIALISLRNDRNIDDYLAKRTTCNNLLLKNGL